MPEVMLTPSEVNSLVLFMENHLFEDIRKNELENMQQFDDLMNIWDKCKERGEDDGKKC